MTFARLTAYAHTSFRRRDEGIENYHYREENAQTTRSIFWQGREVSGSRVDSGDDVHVLYSNRIRGLRLFRDRNRLPALGACVIIYHTSH